MIKIEEQSFGSSTDGDVIKFLTHFHDEDSEPEPAQDYEPTSEQLLEYIDRVINLRTTPMNQIQQYVRQYYTLSDSQRRSLLSGILRKKRLLKRERAKHRARIDPIVKLQPTLYPPHCNSTVIDLSCDQDEKKKKRNRISAQVSRDRKKQYLVQMEDQNKRLHQQNTTVKKENQDLRRKMDQLALNNAEDEIKSRQSTESTNDSYEPKNRFIKLLVFLGILFLFSTLKDMVKGSTAGQQMRFSQDNQKCVSISAEEQGSLIGKVENLFGDFSNEFSHIGGGFKMEVGRKIAGLKRRSTPMMIPSQIYEGLLLSADSISN